MHAREAMRAGLCLFAIIVVSGGCLPTATHVCTDDDQCGAGGRCELDGWCSVVDVDCVSGRAYAASAGPLAGTCTAPGGGGDGGDAGGTDGPVDPDGPDGPEPGRPLGRSTNVCLEGPPLPAAQDACTAEICAAAAYQGCCTTWWDETCVQRAQTACLEQACPTMVVIAGRPDAPVDPRPATWVTAYLTSAPTIPIWQTELPTSQNSLAVSWFDQDGDGRADLFVGGFDERGGGGSLRHQLLRNGGMAEGQLELGEIYGSTGSSTFAVAFADWTGDGVVELAYGGFGGIQLVHSRDGELHDDLQLDYEWVTGLAFGNLDGVDGDGDRDLDLAATTYEHEVPGQPEVGVVRVLRNNGGTFTEVWSDAAANLTGMVDVRWGDVDGDGYPELAIAGNSYVAVYRNVAGVLEADPSFLVAGERTARALLGDVDGDGDLDLVAVGNNGPSRIHRNEAGVLEPTPAWTSAAVHTSRDARLVDVDGDHALDLVLADGHGHGRALINTSANRNLRFSETVAPGLGAVDTIAESIDLTAAP